MDVLSKNTGDQYLAAELNQSTNELENLITSTGITLSSGDLFQIAKAIANYSAHGDFYTDSGVADAYVLAAQGSKQAPTGYGDGLRARFIVGNTNTGASTANVAGLGVKNIFSNGTALVAGELVVNKFASIKFDSGNNRFELTSLVDATTIISGKVELATNAETIAGTDTSRATTPAGIAAAIAAASTGEGIKAWVSFDPSSGTPSILDSFNVSSITDDGVGNYRINFTTPFTNSNYALAGIANRGASLNNPIVAQGDPSGAGTKSTSSCEIVTTVGAVGDYDFVSVMFVGDL